ncbi:unnamed protein product [Enterobius vermicularis]|uniref:AlbA_2 domain-containing protein n=1 Tax=Enterobius vermicularis TaxID=51028 RepID=A0A0N4V0V8_ENTVE|nr:unnamed protein product [Enterobius vermicularis]
MTAMKIAFSWDLKKVKEYLAANTDGNGVFQNKQRKEDDEAQNENSEQLHPGIVSFKQFLGELIVQGAPGRMLIGVIRDDGAVKNDNKNMGDMEVQHVEQVEEYISKEFENLKISEAE